MSRTQVALPTPDGDARAFLFKPDSGSGPWPAAIIAMDAPAIRPALFEMGERLAAAWAAFMTPSASRSDETKMAVGRRGNCHNSANALRP